MKRDTAVVARSFSKPSGRFWTKEDKVIRVRIERARRHRAKVAIHKGEEPDRYRRTEGWESW